MRLDVVTKTVLRLSGAALLCFLCWFAWIAGQAVRQVGFDTSIALGSVQRAGDAVTADAAIVGRPCSTKDANGKLLPCGTLANLGKTLDGARDTETLLNQAALHEDRNLTTLDAQEVTLFGDAHKMLGDADTTILTTNDVLAAFKPLPGQITKTVADVDALATSDDVKNTVHQTAIVATQGAGIATHLNGVSGDMQVALHPILNPDPCKTKGCKIKRDLSGVLKVAGPGAEGLYYMIEVLKELP